MTATEVCAVCGLPHPCPSGHNCGSLTREVPDERKEPVGKHGKGTEPEVRGGESREDWDPSVTEPPETGPVVYEPGDVLPADTEDGG